MVKRIASGLEGAVQTSGGPQTGASFLRRCTLWSTGKAPAEADNASAPAEGIRWFDLIGDPSIAPQVLEQLGPSCPGLTLGMLEDLLDPDEEPSGASYDSGRIRLASTFSVEAKRLDEKVKRGEPQHVGVLVFQPVELLAGSDWLITCWHPRRTFSGADVAHDDPPDSSDELYRAVAARWAMCEAQNAGDLGVLIMHELALSYGPAHWALQTWLQDWELSLYVEDDVSNPEELPRLWGSMAVLRNWLTQLNRPGLRTDPEKAWLPARQHSQVIEVDNRVDKALEYLGDLSNTLRASFSVLHVQLSEKQRERQVEMQHRVELIAAIFLVPTLIVGFYGANTWVPGQGRHWGFWIMVLALLAGTGLIFSLILRWQRAQREENRRAAEERARIHAELLRSL
jgi:hypothetical protein